MVEFGQELRRERERRGVTLETLRAQTKVSLRHLKSLEDGDYNALPGGVFRRGMVRAYCVSLGLEEQQWMARFHASQVTNDQVLGKLHDGEESWVTFAENVKRNRPSIKARNGMRWIVTPAVILLLLIGGWAVWHFVARTHPKF